MLYSRNYNNRSGFPSVPPNYSGVAFTEPHPPKNEELQNSHTDNASECAEDDERKCPRRPLDKMPHREVPRHDEPIECECAPCDAKTERSDNIGHKPSLSYEDLLLIGLILLLMQNGADTDLIMILGFILFSTMF